MDVSDGDSEILLDHDQALLTEDELRTSLRLMNYTREDTLALLRDVSDEMLDWKPDLTTKRSIREIIPHIAYTEFWYLAKLWDENSKEDLLELLAEIRNVVVERLTKLSLVDTEKKTTYLYPAPKPPEEWTARKLHSRIVAKLIAYSTHTPERSSSHLYKLT